MIRKAGEKQSYLFSGQAGQIVYVKFGSCDGAGLHFDLADPANSGIGTTFGCHDFGPVTLTKSGTYQILTYPDPGRPSAHYTFSILPTTFEKYSIKIGDTVSPDHPLKARASSRGWGKGNRTRSLGRPARLCMSSSGRATALVCTLSLMIRPATALPVPAQSAATISVR